MIVVWKISSLIKMKPLQAHTKIKMKEAFEVFILTWLEDFLYRYM